VNDACRKNVYGSDVDLLLDRGRRFANRLHSVRIHKSPDGLVGACKLKGVRVIVNQACAIDHSAIE
jgi:hypothetical protein